MKIREIEPKKKTDWGLFKIIVALIGAMLSFALVILTDDSKSVSTVFLLTFIVSILCLCSEAGKYEAS